MSIYISANRNHSQRCSRIPKQVGDTPILIVTQARRSNGSHSGYIDEPGEIKVTPKDTNETIGTEVTSKDVEKADVFQVTPNDADLAGRTLVTSTDSMY